MLRPTRRLGWSRQGRALRVNLRGSSRWGIRDFEDSVRLAGRALALAEQVARSLGIGFGRLRCAHILLRERDRVLEAAARSLFDAVADEQRRAPSRDRARHGKQ